MAEFTFYRQARADGGIRTGLECGAGSELQSFLAGSTTVDDPSLDWFIDVRGQSGDLPDDIESLRSWLVDHRDEFREGLNSLAARFRVGVDLENWPVVGPFPTDVPGVNLEFAVSAIRRISARDIGLRLEEFADHWVSLLQELQPLVEIA